MTTTTKLGLELLANAAANQTLANTTFAQLNQLVQPGVVARLSAPPVSPADEAIYIVTATATGAWAGKENQLAYWLTSTNAWQFIVPREGFLVHVNDEDIYYKYTGSAWAAFAVGLTNPMTSAADIIVGGSSGTPARLAAGANGFVLTMVAGAVAWAAASGGLTNPMTASGDLIIGGSSGAPTRLAAGTDGHVLTLTAGVPTWAAAASGFANPMNTAGDMIVGGSGGAPARLAKGTDGQMLLMAGGVQVYGNNPTLAGYKETVETMANNAIDVSTSNVKKRVLTANATFTITGATSGFSHTLTLHIEGGNTYSVAWPASFKWLIPIPTLTAKHIISGYTIDGGTTWLINYEASYV